MTKSRSNATAPNAKGTLVVGSGTDASSTLAVGSANQVLTVDSSTATGLKWASASAASFVGCKVTKTAAQTISNTTWTALSFDSEIFDTDAFHDNATNNSRLTIPTGKGGKYLINAQARFDTNATGFRALNIYKNGGAVEYQLMTVPATSGDRSQIAVSVVLNLSAGDYLQVYVYQTSGGNLNVDYGESIVAFSCSYLGA